MPVDSSGLLLKRGENYVSASNVYQYMQREMTTKVHEMLTEWETKASV